MCTLPLHTVIRHTSGMVQHCARGRPPLPSSSPTLPTAARDTVPQRRGLFSGAARTLPGSGRRANDILYIRVRRREGEHVLHRAAGNDVDNFSVDNPLWITAAGGCRLLRGGKWKAMRGKCERGHESANADGAGAEVFAGDGCVQGASFVPMAAISRHGQGGRIYNNTRARVLLRRMCVKPAALTTHSPPKTFARPRTATHPSRALPIVHATPTHARRLCDARPAALTTHSRRRPSLTPAQRHALPEHFRSPTQPRRTPAGCAMHSPPTSPPFLAKALRSPPHSDTPFPSTSAPPRSPDARPQAAQCLPRRPHSPFPAESLRPLPHSDTPSPSISARPRSADARPQAARYIPHCPHHPFPAAPRCLPFRSASGTKKRHRTVHVRCRMSRSTVVAVGHLGW